MASSRSAGGKGDGGRWKLRDELTGKTSSGTVGFFPSKVLESHKNPKPLGPTRLPALRLQTPATDDAAPARPAAAAELVAGALARPGERAGHAERASHGSPGGRWPSPMGREGRPRTARLATFPLGGEESPTCPALCLGRAGPTVPMQRLALSIPAFQKTSTVTSSTETFRHKTPPRGRAASQTHSLTDAHRSAPASSRTVEGCCGVSNSMKINKTKASPRCPFRRRAYLLHCFLSISGLPPWAVVVFVSVFFFSFLDLPNQCAQLICRAMFPFHPAARTCQNGQEFHQQRSFSASLVVTDNSGCHSLTKGARSRLPLTALQSELNPFPARGWEEMRVLLAVRADKRTLGGAHSAPSSGLLPGCPGPRCCSAPARSACRPALPQSRRAGLCPRPHPRHELPGKAKSQYEDLLLGRKSYL